MFTPLPLTVSQCLRLLPTDSLSSVLPLLAFRNHPLPSAVTDMPRLPSIPSGCFSLPLIASSVGWNRCLLLLCCVTVFFAVRLSFVLCCVSSCCVVLRCTGVVLLYFCLLCCAVLQLHSLCCAVLCLLCCLAVPFYWFADVMFGVLFCAELCSVLLCFALFCFA